MIKIMVVDDDPYIRELIRLYLKNEDYGIMEAEDGEEALRLLSEASVGLVILDIMMPKMDGWELCRTIRSHYDLPVLMISAKSETVDKIKGFQVGTDDYLAKPFDPVEMIMRVKALLKRYKVSTASVIRFGELEIDGPLHEVRVNKEKMHLPPKEFDILFKLANYPNKIFTRGDLIEQIWGSDFDGDERTVDVHIKRLRDKFDDLAPSVKIVTVRGLGYRIEVAHV